MQTRVKPHSPHTLVEGATHLWHPCLALGPLKPAVGLSDNLLHLLVAQCRHGAAIWHVTLDDVLPLKGLAHRVQLIPLEDVFTLATNAHIFLLRHLCCTTSRAPMSFCVVWADLPWPQTSTGLCRLEGHISPAQKVFRLIVGAAMPSEIQSR